MTADAMSAEFNSPPGPAQPSAAASSTSLTAPNPTLRARIAGLPGVRKAAILMVAMGDELGKKILQNLP
jgi:flagellar motor switch protein FliG